MSWVQAIKAIRKRLRPVRRLVDAARARLLELPYLFQRPPAGTAAWLIRCEVKYGGIVHNVPRLKVSPRDVRSPEQLSFGGMSGGDRMLHHGYAPIYANYVAPLIGSKGLVVAEFGILKGTGLAIWCDLFTDSRVLGFDIDTSHFESNREALVRRGAFSRNMPEVFEYDQLIEGSAKLGKILNGQKLDVVIDDGLHSIEAIVTTWRSVKPHLSNRFVYFIEDVEGLLAHCGAEFLEFECFSHGMLTVICAGDSTSK